MIGDILSKIQGSEEQILATCGQRMQQSGHPPLLPAIEREDLARILAAVLDTLRAAPSEWHDSPAAGTRDLQPWYGAVLEEARRHRDRGVCPGRFFAAFKTVVQSLEDRVLVQNPPDTAALREMRRIADSMETVLVTDWEMTEAPGETEGHGPPPRPLLREKAVLERIFSSMTDLVLMTDHEGRIIDASPGTGRFWRRETVLGLSLGELLGESFSSVPGILDAFPPGMEHELSLSHKDVDGICRLRIFPCSPGRERPGGIVLFLGPPDTESHRSRPAHTEAGRLPSQANEDKMHRAIFRSVGEGIVLVDEDFEIINANHQAAEIYGIPLQNLIGSDVRLITDENGAHRLLRSFDTLVEGHRFNAEITGVYVDGRTFPTNTTVTRIDYDGKRFWAIIVHDISEWKAMERRLSQEKQQTEEMNVTLRNVLHSIEKDRRDFENRLSARIRTSILPALERLGKEPDAEVRQSYLSILGQQLTSLTSGFATELDAGLLKLSRTEIEVCRLIQSGCSNKEICEAMNVCFETVQTHRKNIRRKLGLRGRKVNLHAFLSKRAIDTEQDSTKREDNQDER